MIYVFRIIQKIFLVIDKGFTILESKFQQLGISTYMILEVLVNKTDYLKG